MVDSRFRTATPRAIAPPTGRMTLLRQHGISRTTFFKWRSKYAGASVADVKRLRELEGENAKLRQMYADLALENAAIKDVLARKL